MKAIIIGGTGATGKELVTQLLADQRFEAVTVLVRRPYFEAHPKLTEIIVDFEKLNDYQKEITGDVAFSTLGTTLKDAGSKAAQWRVDHDYQLEFAKIAKANGVQSFVLLSAFGANMNSSFFYNKMKGTLEVNMQKLGFSQLLVLHPGGIERPDSNRTGEKVLMKMLKILNALGIFKGYSPISTQRLAKAMIASYFEYKVHYKIVSLEEIKALSI